MVDVAERLKGFDPVYVFKLIGDFLGEPWVTGSLDQFKYQVLSQGFGNRLFICSLVDASGTSDASDSLSSSSGTTAARDCITPRKESITEEEDVALVPRHVLVRFYGGNVLPRNNPIRTLNETTEALLFLILGREGLGPRLHGVFQGGRIEEFIASRNLTVSEFASDDLVNRAIAVIVAKYHCLKALPFLKIPWNIPAILRSSYEGYKNLASTGVVDELIDEPLKQKLHSFLTFDVASEIQWIESILDKINSRVVFTHNDLNRSNILLREKVQARRETRRATAASEQLQHQQQEKQEKRVSGSASQQSSSDNNDQCSNYDHPSGLLKQNKSPSNETITSEASSENNRGTSEAGREEGGSRLESASHDDEQENEEKSHFTEEKEGNSDAHSFEHMVDRLLLVDYEFSGYNYRGVDIGNHFGMKVFDFGSHCFITGLPYPSEKARRSFIRSYIKQVRDSCAFPDWDPLGLDSEEHILLEAEFGGLMRRLTNISGMLGGLRIWIPIAAKRSKIDPSFKDGRVFTALVESYVERKAAFLKQWPHFAPSFSSSSSSSPSSSSSS